jgi:hypothetical protein
MCMSRLRSAGIVNGRLGHSSTFLTAAKLLGFENIKFSTGSGADCGLCGDAQCNGEKLRRHSRAQKGPKLTDGGR